MPGKTWDGIGTCHDLGFPWTGATWDYDLGFPGTTWDMGLAKSQVVPGYLGKAETLNQRHGTYLGQPWTLNQRPGTTWDFKFETWD